MVYGPLPCPWHEADGGWAIPPKSVRRLTAPQAPCPNRAMRLNISLPSSLRGPHWRPWPSSQYERFSFGTPLLIPAWLAMPHGFWPTPARRQDGVASHGKHLAVSRTIFKTKEGTSERQRLASSYSWYPFPGLSHLSRLEARGWPLKDNCAPCDSGSARVNPSLRAPELGPHLPHIPDHRSSGRRGALRSLPGRGDRATADLLHWRTCDSDARADIDTSEGK